MGWGRGRPGWIVVLLALLGSCAPKQLAVPDALRERHLMVPVAGVAPGEVPDTFDSPRGRGRRHEALDIVAPRGTQVVSTDDGRVLKLRNNRLGGLSIYAADPSGEFVYYYAHLNAYRTGLRPGDHLRQGDVIAYVGSSGNADRREPHLHFQVMRRPADGRWWGGRPIDPLPYLERAGRAR